MRLTTACVSYLMLFKSLHGIYNIPTSYNMRQIWEISACIGTSLIDHRCYEGWPPSCCHDTHL